MTCCRSSTRVPVPAGAEMSRVQLALNVSDLAAAVDFYSRLFDSEPAKRRPGYANFVIGEPPLKLVLVETAGTPGTLNHLGVEVGSIDEVHAATERLVAAGLAVAPEQAVECCYARQEKVWVDDPDGAPWEIYTVLGTSEIPGGALRAVSVCGPDACACAATDQPADAPPRVSGA
jgi:catechol 2,3-dioxygenase-like lactoylglutathione lyase family enzyme